MKQKTLSEEIQELDELASKFIIGHKRLSKRQKYILDRIEKLKLETKILENKKNRIDNLIKIMYKKLVDDLEVQNE